MTAPVVTYQNIFDANFFVTGIRQDSAGGQDVIISGNYPQSSGGKPQALLYRGPIYPTDSSGYAYLTPVFAGQTVTTSTFYGPNTPLFNPEIGAHNVRAVGSYKYSDGGKLDHAMMYEGALDGSGVWTPLIVPNNLTQGTVANTLAHSTMGDLVVGNYDLADQPASANAFIYNVKTKTYQVLAIGELTTAYGVWQNGGAGSSSYTIVGGYKSGDGVNKGYLLNYDAASGAISHLTAYTYNDDPAVLTHFEGITGVANGYTLAATTDSGAAFASIALAADGTFGAAQWLLVAAPGSKGLTTANSILENNLIGIYTAQNGGVQSFVATVAPAATAQ
jgi:hypothetical protein